MRANLILLMAAATLAACGSSTAPDEANDNGLPSPAVAAIPDAPSAPAPSASGGGGASQTGTGFGGPADGTEPPCLQAVRLASDLLPGPVSCRR